jgi:tetratricopeptide (TPR) repeat protein
LKARCKELEDQVEDLEERLEKETRLRKAQDHRVRQKDEDLVVLRKEITEKNNALREMQRVIAKQEKQLALAATQTPVVQPVEVAATPPTPLVAEAPESESVETPVEPEPVIFTEPEPEPVNETDQALVEEGYRLFEEGRFEEARKLFAGLLDRQSGNQDALLGLAICHYYQDRIAESVEYLDWLLELDPGQVDALALRGMILFRQGRPRDALRVLQQVLSIQPEHVQAHHYKGLILYQQGSVSEAEKAFRKALALDPEHAEAAYNLSVILVTLDTPRLEEAREYYESALRLGSERNEKLEEILYP